jgi:RHS repeat-associated protein
VYYPDGNQVLYTYTNGVVSSITLNIGGTLKTGYSQITYQPLDQAMASWVGSNGLTTSLFYDTDGRFTGANVPAVLTYGIYYDNADRVSKKQDFISPILTQNFAYDEQSRLVSETGSAENESYQYDADGNRIAQTVNSTSMNLIYEGGSNRMINAGGVIFGYDALGNTFTANGINRWQFDPFNRMTTAFGNTYYIDPEGQRLMKTVGTTTTYFAPDESNHLMAENDAGLWVDYVWLNGRLIGRIHDGQVQDIHVDQVGRPEAMTDANQTVIWRLFNLPFTREVGTNNVVPLNIGFPGQYFDAELSLWNNGYRDYFDWVGRYLESDPVGLDGGINTYAYVAGSPINITDTFGLAEDGAEVNSENCAALKQLVQFEASHGKFLTIAAYTANFSDHAVALDAPFQTDGGLVSADWMMRSSLFGITAAPGLSWMSYRLIKSSWNAVNLQVPWSNISGRANSNAPAALSDWYWHSDQTLATIFAPALKKCACGGH